MNELPFCGLPGVCFLLIGMLVEYAVTGPGQVRERHRERPIGITSDRRISAASKTARGKRGERLHA